LENKQDNDSIVIIPHERLSSESLKSLIEEFVTRDGTDYGETDVPLQRKIDQVMRQILSGKTVILFHESSQTVDIVSTDDHRVKDRSVKA